MDGNKLRLKHHWGGLHRHYVHSRFHEYLSVGPACVVIPRAHFSIKSKEIG